MSKELVISSNRHETKLALIEDDQLVEVYFQRSNEYSLAGSIHKGRVTRVLPGMQAAFIDIGLERAAFLHVEDLIRPDDFDAYLAGRHQHGSGSEDDDRSSSSSQEDGSRVERNVSISLPTALDVAEVDVPMRHGRFGTACIRHLNLKAIELQL